MKNKYITTQILLASRPKRAVVSKDIHTLLEQTIAERKIVLALWEKAFPDLVRPKTDIHTMLRETIAERQRLIAEWERIFYGEDDDSIYIKEKQAA